MRCDGDIHVSTFFELHVVAMFVGQLIFDAEIPVLFVGRVHGNLRLFRF